MGPYNLPRNVKGEGRILFIFSVKALLFTMAGAAIGIIFYLIFNVIGMNFVGIIFVGAFGLIGFLIGTFKVPETTAFEITKKTGGENIDEVIKRYIEFKMQKNKIYIYQDEKKNVGGETKDG